MVLACSLAACSAVGFPPPAPAGSREWRINVENMSGAPARLLVAEDTMPVGKLVGTAVPDAVPAGVSQEVVFTVPPGDTWAIFVNPGPQLGPLILARDVPADVAGELRITIGIGPDGQPSVSTPGDLGPGWFGN